MWGIFDKRRTLKELHVVPLDKNEEIAPHHIFSLACVCDPVPIKDETQYYPVVVHYDIRTC